MVWFVQPLQKRNEDGSPSGIWHLVASSDEGGGQSPGCHHDHKSPLEASECEEAQRLCGQITGFPWVSPAEEAAKEEANERAELARLQKKYGVDVTDLMVSRFLGWRLPDSFNPDGGIKFTPPGLDGCGYIQNWPSGTNLLTAEEARAMLRHVLG